MSQCLPEPYYNEIERLQALRDYRVLDTPQEKDFDDIVALASKICDTPIALVNLISEGRQWFKAKVGVEVSEMPLDVSICAHAILQHDIFEVHDTTADARFRDNPLVTMEDGLRFYTGAILKTPEGLPIGMLCVLDRKPRQLDPTQKFALGVLATQVMKQLELRKSALRLAEKNDELTHFSHAIAHDLRDPMGSVKLLAEMLKIQHAAAMPQRAAEMVDAIVNTSSRSLLLLNNLLALAEAEDRQLLAETCDGNAVLATTLENLHAVIGASGAKIESESLPKVAMSAVEFGQVLQNLISNAINYRDLSRPCRIRVTVSHDGGQATICVRDNGIGIPAENAAAIFAPLKRLHGSERPGTGLGLTITRKIIERRGGKIWVESKLGEGTSFCFSVASLPAPRLKATA